MPHWKATLSYDGTPYNGWQIQPNLPTVQGTLAHAIQHITGESVLPQGSGRTDTGVHALAQVATFTLTVPIPQQNLHRALNRALPPSIRILSIEQVTEDFHARHSAHRKTYEYRIFPRIRRSALEHPEPRSTNSDVNNAGATDADVANAATERICPPTLAPYVWDCHLPLDLSTLQNAAAQILGTHDFTSFAAADPDLTTRNNAASPPQPPPTPEPGAAPEPDAPSFAHPQMCHPERSEAESKDLLLHLPGAPYIDSDVWVRSPSTNPDSPGAPSLAVSSLRVGTQTVHPPASAVAGPLPPATTRTIYQSTWTQTEDLLIYRITGNGFLHHMVRNLVGTFVEAGSGRIHPKEIPTILATRNRSAAGPTAPARGLFLVEVEY